MQHLRDIELQSSRNEEKPRRNVVGKRWKKQGMIFGSLLLFVVVCLQSQQTTHRIHRLLSINFGGGRCKWTAPTIMEQTNPLNTTTLLASYPGSGKRLTWRILEALTGKVTGDDWDLSERGYDSVLTLKSSWPHPEGVWNWDGHMDQVILLVRNPRFAIPSYHTIRSELDWSTTWTQSYNRQNNTYTERAPVESWEYWRDARFDVEMDRWVWYIDFWMQDGLRRNNTQGTGPEQDWHCFHGLLDCTPKAVIQFERLMSPNPLTGQAEMNKIGSVLDSSPNVNAIEPEARPCVYNEVMSKRQLYNPNRDGNGPSPDLKVFTIEQLATMKTQLEELRDKYALHPWTEQPIAVDLVHALNFYINEVEVEYDLAVQQNATAEE